VAGGVGSLGYGGDRLRPAGGRAGRHGAEGWFLVALPCWAGWLPGRTAGSFCAWPVPLLLAGWVQCGLREVGGPLDDQAGSLVGGAGDFRLGITSPTARTSMITGIFRA